MVNHATKFAPHMIDSVLQTVLKCKVNSPPTNVWQHQCCWLDTLAKDSESPKERWDLHILLDAKTMTALQSLEEVNQSVMKTKFRGIELYATVRKVRGWTDIAPIAF